MMMTSNMMHLPGGRTGGGEQGEGVVMDDVLTYIYIGMFMPAGAGSNVYIYIDRRWMDDDKTADSLS